MRSILLAALLLATTNSIADDISGSISVGSKTRTYLLHVPSNLPSGPVPLLLVFHGLGLNGSSMANITQFSPLADSEKFIVVYPDGQVIGPMRQWTSPGNNTDDLDFVTALIQKLKNDYSIDGSRVYAAGASNGGMFTYRVGLELTNQVNGIAVVAGFLPKYSPSPVPSPAHPLSVQHFHGTSDTTVNYSKGVAAVDHWVGANQCSPTPSPSASPLPDISNDGTTVQFSAYGGCSNNTKVEFYTITNGGHTWPGSSSLGSGGNISYDINATSLIWNFFNGGHSANVPPTVSWTQPSDGSSFTAPANIALRANASDADGSIVNVEFFNGSNSLRVDTSAPYGYIWQNVPAGVYNLKAVATDNLGAQSEAVITVTVN